MVDFCYADKFAILMNGLGIVRHISFIDDNAFKASHHELNVEKKTDSPNTFLDDSAELYGKLFHDFHFSRAVIPYNPRNESHLKKVGYNAYGYPTCPNDPSLPMKYCRITKEKGRTNRVKWIYPKMHYHKSGSVIVINFATLPKRAGQLTPTKIWIYECFPKSNVILMNGIILIK